MHVVIRRRALTSPDIESITRRYFLKFVASSPARLLRLRCAHRSLGDAYLMSPQDLLGLNGTHALHVCVTVHESFARGELIRKNYTQAQALGEYGAGLLHGTGPVLQLSDRFYSSLTGFTAL